jgi:hypothetical protein
MHMHSSNGGRDVMCVWIQPPLRHAQHTAHAARQPGTESTHSAHKPPPTSASPPSPHGRPRPLAAAAPAPAGPPCHSASWACQTCRRLPCTHNTNSAKERRVRAGQVRGHTHVCMHCVCVCGQPCHSHPPDSRSLVGCRILFCRLGPPPQPLLVLALMQLPKVLLLFLKRLGPPGRKDWPAPQGALRRMHARGSPWLLL